MPSEVSLSDYQAKSYPQVVPMCGRWKVFEQKQSEEVGIEFFSALRMELGIIRKAIGTKMLYALLMGNSFGGNYDLWALQQKQASALKEAKATAKKNQALFDELKALRAEVKKLKQAQ